MPPSAVSARVRRVSTSSHPCNAGCEAVFRCVTGATGAGRNVHSAIARDARNAASVADRERARARAFTVVVWGALSLCALGCGERGGVAEADQNDNNNASDGGSSSSMACGFGPPCDVHDFGGRTCESLGLPAGTLSCDPSTCFLVLTGCGRNDTGGSAGTGTTMPGGPGAGTGPVGGVPGAAGMDAGTLFGAGFFGTGMATDEDGGTAAPALFGPGFFGAGN